MQVEVLHSFLESFYDSSEKEGSTIYSKSEQKKTLLLMHVLIAALISQKYQMGARSCDLLRQALKLSPVQMSALYRSGPGISFLLQLFKQPVCTV